MFIHTYTQRYIYAGCSANSDAETSRSALAAGMSVFIPKPLTIKSFQIAYHNLLLSSPLTAANNPIPNPTAYLAALSSKGVAAVTPTNTAAATALSRNVPPRPSGSSSQQLGGGSIRQASRTSSTT